MKTHIHPQDTVRPLVGLLLLGLAGCRTPLVETDGRLVVGTVPTLEVPHTASPPTVDGALDEASWRDAAVIPALLPVWRATGRDLAIPATTVRVMWDEQFLYVGFDCLDGEVFCSGTRKHDDLLYQEDVCEVFLDGVGDGRQFVEIQVNPEGVNLDLMYILTRAASYTPEMRLTPDLCKRDRWKFLEWEMAGLRTAARRTATGWSAELAIPAESIMQRNGSAVFRPAEIRANFIRYDWLPPATGDQRILLPQNWSPVLSGNPHNSPARMGRLALLESPTGKP